MAEKKTADTKVVETAAVAADTKATAEKKASAAKATAAKKPAEKKATAAKKAPAAKKPAEKKATTAKKPAAEKKPAAKKTAAAVESKVVIQGRGTEVNTDELIKKAIKASGKKNAEKVDLYVIPEANKVYYVIDGVPSGDIDLF
ncbi:MULTISPECIES: DUF6465 family protein [Ruminococcus]|uniref:RNA polymerase primary sigma factor n=1 Tax=Ruminococcus flavefaciens TaxID=1265 RepID=A0A1M7J9T0_RUMFL|nr:MULTISPECIES: DUF6465 family protein [Ruminococcus]MCR4793804.1 DUF6465 family protein [Ruminococcus sp.]SHM49744.1 hypothetical protein SAMN04487860_105219 [Ruminococcus flavefaciens]